MSYKKKKKKEKCPNFHTKWTEELSGRGYKRSDRREKFRILVERAFRCGRGYADASAAPRINKLCRVSAYPVGVTPYVENQYPIHIRILAEVRFSTCLALSLFYHDAICLVLARSWEIRSYAACSDDREVMSEAFTNTSRSS